MNKSLWEAWSLLSEDGRQRWVFDKEKAKQLTNSSSDSEWIDALDKQFVCNTTQNPNTGDAVLRNKKIVSFDSDKAHSATDSLNRGIDYFSSLQQSGGNWAGDYGGPHFLLPGLIFVCYACQEMPSIEKQTLMKRYLLNHQNQDGGWGLHIEDKSTMFGTVLNVVSLVLCGKSIQSDEVQKAFHWIQKNGGTESIPPWGKLYLATLGLYDWKGLDALLPELWILPKKLPIYPGNYWNHARMVYLPMSYLSGKQFVAEQNETLASIRQALYPKGYQNVDWKKARRLCCKLDDYFPEPKFYQMVVPLLNAYNRLPIPFFRKRALKNVSKLMEMEDFHTNYINLGPVNKVLNLLCTFIEEGKSERFYKHIDRLDDYLWIAEDGMKMNGYNGSQFWDTIFFSHALLEKKQFSPKDKQIISDIERFITSSLVRENERENIRFDRSISKGGWPFSTSSHGWPITDCTAEGIKAVVYLNQKGLLTNAGLLTSLVDSIHLILSYQNKDGGWASYEKTRAPKWLEKMNPSRVFGEIMIDYSYTECTSACLQALNAYFKSGETPMPTNIEKVIAKGVRFIKNRQTESGLWYGAWAVCFTYGTWFAIEAITQCEGLFYQRKDSTNCITKACNALVAHQNLDGSWGESYESCLEKKYIPHREGQVVNTAWALLTLMAAQYDDHSVIEHGIRFLVEKQQENGDWEQQGISGVFNHNCMITYINYRNIFPIWALQRFDNQYGG